MQEFLSLFLHADLKTTSQSTVVGHTTLPFCTIAILPFRLLRTPTQQRTTPVLGNAAPWLWNNFVQVFCWEQDLNVPMWVTGKREQIFLRCMYGPLVDFNDFWPILCYLGHFVFLAITCQRVGLSKSNAVHPLKYLYPISVLRIELRESITVEIRCLVINGVRLLMPHPTWQCQLTTDGRTFWPWRPLSAACKTFVIFVTCLNLLGVQVAWKYKLWFRI